MRSNFKNICENRSKHTQIKRVIDSSVFLEGYDKKSFLWIFLLKQKNHRILLLIGVEEISFAQKIT